MKPSQIPVGLITDICVEEAYLEITRNFNTASRGKFQQTEKTIRETYSYGHEFHKLKRGDFTKTFIPKSFRDVCAAAIKVLEPQISRKLPDVSKYTNCIVSIYEKGGKLEPHFDQEFFGKDVIGVVLEADKKGRFFVQEQKHRNQRLPFNEARDLCLEEKHNMAYLLTGELRHQPYLHGVSEVENRRVSLTFRTVEIK